MLAAKICACILFCLLLIPLGGFLYVDDYGSWGGAARAVLDWLAENQWPADGVPLAGGGTLAFATRRPRGATGHGAFYAWKSSPYDPQRPFSEGGFTWFTRRLRL